MRIDPGLVEKVARLSALGLAPEETGRLAAELTRIVEHFEALGSIPDSELGGLPDAPPTPLRTDLPEARVEAPWVRANAPETARGHFVVPRVVSRDE